MAKLKRRLLSPISKRTFNELVMGSSTYMPKNAEERRAKTKLDLEWIELRKAQTAETKRLRRAKIKAKK